jgi:hypothetical protein
LTQIVLLLEEPSMREALEGLLPRLLPEDVGVTYVVHEGKSSLEESIPRKLRAWGVPDARFVILRDKDQADCRTVKRRLQDLCAQGGRPDALVRVVCHHLEAWFLGDLSAVEQAFGLEGLDRRRGGRRARRDPDGLPNAHQILKELVPQYQKLSGARRIGACLSPERNLSRSFQVFVEGLRRLLAA